MRRWTISRHPSRRNAVKLSLATVFVVLIALLGVRAYFVLRAASLIYSLSPTPSPRVIRAYVKLFRHPTEKKDFFIAGKNGPISVRMIFPTDSPNAPIVVLVHGLAPKGNKDGLLNFVALRMAQIGLRVVMPNIPCEQHRLMRASDMDDIGATVQWSAHVSGQRVALFGISFGGGMALATAEMPQYANLIKVFFSDAGYNDLERLGHYYIGEKVTAPDGRPYQESPPGSGPLLIAFQYLDEMVPAKDVHVMRKLILSEDLNHSGGPAPSDVLTPMQNKLYDDLRTVRTQTIREKYHQMLDRHHAEWVALSPDRNLGQMRTPIYILHGADDHSIPPEEALWTLHEAPRGEKIKVVITPWLTHAVLRGRASIWEKLRVGNFICEVLRATFRRVPL
ncbi:MAG: alpha/beta hydrolase family protein [Acidobacteriaceae bacterium]